jgi:hypothetical protein
MMDEAKTAVEGMTTEEKEAAVATADLREEQDKLAKQQEKQPGLLGKAGQSWTEFNSAIGVVKQGLQAIQGVWDGTIGKTLAYGKEVRQMGVMTGLAATESSRLIQIADDLQIGYGDLEMGLKNLNQNGIQGSIENLKKMADEYLALGDPVLKAQYAMEKFGVRAGPEMQKLLEQGSAGIDKLNAGVNAGLVLNDKQVNELREVEKAQDDVNDAWDGMVTQLSMNAMPTILKLINVLSDAFGALDNLVNYGSKVNVMFEEQNQNMLVVAKNYDEYATEMVRAKLIQMGMTKEQAASLSYGEKDIEMVKGRAAALGIMSEGQFEGIRYTKQYNQTLAEHARVISEKVVPAVESVQEKMTEYNILLSGSWTKANEDYTTQMGDLTTTHDDLITKIDDLKTKKPWGWQKEVADYEGQLGEVDEAIIKLKDDHEIAMKQMMLGWIQQWLAAKGVTDEQAIPALMNIAKNWGLITDEEVAAFDQAKVVAEGIAKIPKDIDMNFHYNYTYTQSGTRPKEGQGSSGGDLEHFAEGGSFTVPGGFGGIDNKLVSFWATPGEEVDVRRPGDSGGKNVTLVYQPLISLTNREEALSALRPILDEWARE